MIPGRSPSVEEEEAFATAQYHSAVYTPAASVQQADPLPTFWRVRINWLEQDIARLHTLLNNPNSGDSTAQIHMNLGELYRHLSDAMACQADLSLSQGTFIRQVWQEQQRSRPQLRPLLSLSSFPRPSSPMVTQPHVQAQPFAEPEITPDSPQSADFKVKMDGRGGHMLRVQEIYDEAVQYQRYRKTLRAEKRRNPLTMAQKKQLNNRRRVVEYIKALVTAAGITKDEAIAWLQNLKNTKNLNTSQQLTDFCARQRTLPVDKKPNQKAGSGDGDEEGDRMEESMKMHKKRKRRRYLFSLEDYREGMQQIMELDSDDE
ncbi:hypothetical protein BGW42_006040 [Actinomortierella wolfii]|nr:hypothetical protein BGW42_006040 [Actinomortierella wolfii]